MFYKYSQKIIIKLINNKKYKLKFKNNKIKMKFKKISYKNFKMDLINKSLYNKIKYINKINN